MAVRVTAVLIRTLVIDDEPLARRRVRRLLATHNGFDVVGEAADGVTALTMIAKERPALIFLDVQMPGLDGLGVASAVALDPPPVIVFVTAFDQFAAGAFDLNAADYLLKPYDSDRFAAAIDRVRRRLGQTPSGSTAPIEHLLVTSFGQVRLLPVGMIERIDAAGNYAEVIMAGGARHLVRQSLSALAGQLPAAFVRVHRSAIIRVDRVASMASTGHGDAQIVLTDGTTALLSRRFRPRLIERIATNKSR